VAPWPIAAEGACSPRRWHPSRRGDLLFLLPMGKPILGT